MRRVGCKLVTSRVAFTTFAPYKQNPDLFTKLPSSRPEFRTLYQAFFYLICPCLTTESTLISLNRRLRVDLDIYPSNCLIPGGQSSHSCLKVPLNKRLFLLTEWVSSCNFSSFPCPSTPADSFLTRQYALGSRCRILPPSLSMSPAHIIDLTRAVSNIHISEDISRTTISPRDKNSQLTARTKSAVVKSQSHQHRAGRGKRWGLLQECKARTRDSLPLVIRRKEEGNLNPGERPPQPRTTGPKTLQKMTEALFWAIVESGAINHRRFPRFLPMSLKAALPEKGTLYAEKKLTANERLLRIANDDDPFKSSSVAQRVDLSLPNDQDRTPRSSGPSGASERVVSNRISKFALQKYSRLPLRWLVTTSSVSCTSPTRTKTEHG